MDGISSEESSQGLKVKNDLNLNGMSFHMGKMKFWG